MTKTLFRIFMLGSYLTCVACNNNVQPKRKPNDTLAIIQAILDSKLLEKEFYYEDGSLPQLYTRFKYRRKGTINTIDSVETIHLVDSFFIYKGIRIKLGDTAYDLDRQYKKPWKGYPDTRNGEFVMGLGAVKKIKGNEAWFGFGFPDVNIDVTAHLKKINGKWEVIDYEWGQS